MLLFRKKNSKDYATISSSAMILHEFPDSDETEEQVSIVFKDATGWNVMNRYDKIEGIWTVEEDRDLKYYVLDFIKDNSQSVIAFKKGEQRR